MRPEPLTEEQLQTCVDGLSEISSGDRSRLGENLLEFLTRNLHLDLACVRLTNPVEGTGRDIIVCSGGLPRERLHALLASSAGRSREQMPFIEGSLSVLRLPLGARGVLLAGAERKDFPRARERLLLTAAASQATIALEGNSSPPRHPRPSESRSGSLTNRLDLQQIIDLIPALAWVCTPESVPEFFNQYYLDYVGRSREQMMGDGWSMNLHPDDVSSLSAEWAAIMASRRPGVTQARIRRADGEYRWFLFCCNPLLDDDGNVVRWFGVNADIDDRKRVEDMLRDTQAELTHMTRAMTMGQLTASIAHELNQPLSGIITNAGTCLRMLAADPPNIDGARETARRTIRDGNRASEVIARLRALFSKKTTSAEPVDLNSATLEVITLASNQLVRMSANLRTELSANLPPVVGDRIQLQQVILNLILNAAESMADVHSRLREIVVSTTQDGPDRVRLAVRDVGIGLDASSIEKLFAPFYSTKRAGMGIGLSVSRSIVEHHQGRIWAEPNEGPGATFLFSIPVQQTAASADDSSESSHRASDAAGLGV